MAKFEVIENFLNHDSVRAELVEASMPFDKLRANGDLSVIHCENTNNWEQELSGLSGHSGKDAVIQPVRHHTQNTCGNPH